MAAYRGRIVVAAPWSGSGKTTLTLLLLAGLKARGLRVQSFKVGPDYIDGTYHTALTGRPARNLDLWMGGGPDDVFRQLAAGERDADLSVVEGVMGFFDSGAPDGVDISTAQVARTIRAPVILVVDGSRMAESAAALVYGFVHAPASPGVQGVILNQVAGAGHYQLLERAIRLQTGVPVLGYVPKQADLAIPERHLGLVPAVERQELARRVAQAAQAASETLDWERILHIAGSAPALPRDAAAAPDRAGPPVPVALAQDEAFHFYYAANLELLASLGAEILPFSPLRGDPIPEAARLLYVGGGFPEEFLSRFRELKTAHAGYRARLAGGLMTLAECGGYIWLARSLGVGSGPSVPLVGLVPAVMRLEPRLQAIGYRTVSARDGGPWPAGTIFRGHEFHNSRVVEADPHPAAWSTRSRRGEGTDGFLSETVVAGFTHLYFPSNPDAMASLLARAGGR
ncbi:MAG: cobyrinate a,c-diamide synthase [Clostridia bacterium]